MTHDFLVSLLTLHVHDLDLDALDHLAAHPFAVRLFGLVSWCWCYHLRHHTRPLLSSQIAARKLATDISVSAPTHANINSISITLRILAAPALAVIVVATPATMLRADVAVAKVLERRIRSRGSG